jgi:membrane associated rhomboid family serine protease
MSYYNNGNRVQRTTSVVLNLIIINAIVFLLENVITSVDITKMGALYYYKSPYFKPYQLVTHMFLHANFTHILFNMYGLWLFGTILERFWGPKKFLIIYLACGIGAAIFEQILTPFSALQIAKHSSEYLSGQASLADVVNAHLVIDCSIGASGAIMGLYAAFGYLFPNTEFFIFFIPIPIKAKYLIPLFVLYDLFGAVYYREGDNVAHLAHLGGAIVGFLIVFISNKVNRKTFY